MKTYFIGDLVKKRCKELGLTQEQLCEGICEPLTISRLENGKQTPSMNTLRVILQRLGMPEHKYYALTSQHESQIADLQTEIISSNTLKDRKRGLQALSELEEIADPDDHLLQQFILRSKALLGKEKDGKIVPYPLEEELELLFQAIRLTAPKFDIDAIYEGLYSMDEVKVINQIACVYSDLKQRKKAVDIYDQLLQYIERHFQNILQSGGLLPLVSYNYARELNLVGRYEEAIEIAETGWKACVQYGQYHTLPATVALIAECCHFLGKDEKSKDYYKQAYYISKAIDCNDCLHTVMKEVKEYFGDDFSF